MLKEDASWEWGGCPAGQGKEECIILIFFYFLHLESRHGVIFL